MLNNKIKVFVTCLIIGNMATAAPSTVVTKEQATQALTSLSVPFEENRGQADAKVAFQARTLAGPLFVTKTGELVWTLAPPSRAGEEKRIPPLSERRDAPTLHSAEFVGPPTPTYSVVEKFIGGAPKPAGAVPAATQVSYFHGNDRSKWQNSVPTWNQVSLGEVWPGIDVKLAARGKNVEKLFTVAPGADVSKIAIAVKGGEVTVAKDGGLNVGWGEQREPQPIGKNVGVRSSPRPTLLAFTAPVAYQLINGERKAVPVAYRLFPPSSRGRARVGVETVAMSQPPSQPSPYQGEGVYGFTLGAHDATQPVIIDPLLQATYLGGSNEDRINAIAVTADAVYVAGYTYSANFPGVSGGAQAACVCGDAFVAKLSLDLKSLIQASYLGGNSNDGAYALTVTSSEVYVAGDTNSSNFPATSGGAQATGGGSHDGFVAKLSLDLKSLTQASYLGGSDWDQAFALAVTSNAVYVTGFTESSNFPGTSGAAQASFGGGNYDAFIAKLNLDLTSLSQASYLGGSDDDYCYSCDLAVSSSAVYVAGRTESSSFPGTSGGAQASFGGGYDDVFIAKLNLDLTSLTQASFLGGSGFDHAQALAVTNTNLYVAGNTTSSNLPRTSGGAQASFGGSDDVFIAKFNLDLTSLTQASFLGGSNADMANALTVSSSAVYVAGYTTSSNFPATSGGAQASFDGSNDAFVAKLSVDLKSLTQASYLGESSSDVAYALAVTSSAVYVAGQTYSSNFPGTSGGAQASFGGGTCGINPDTYPCDDGFIAKLTPDLQAVAPISAPSVSTNAPSLITSTSATVTGTVNPNGAVTTVTFDFGPTTNYGTTSNATPNVIAATAAATTVTANKTGLNCHTTYHFRVKATNSAGTATGNDQSFTTANCPAVNGVCGTANGATFSTAPTTNLCSSGIASAVTGTGPWNWSCNGQNGGTTAICAANLATYTVTPSAGTGGTVSPNTPQTVNYGATKSFTVTANSGYSINNVVTGTCPQGYWNSGSTSSPSVWTTGAITGNCSVSFSFTFIPVVVNGACGTANGNTFTTAPTTNLCSSGIASAVSGTGPWTWTCSGANGGNNASCAANITAINSWLAPPSKSVLPDYEFTLDVTTKSNSMRIQYYDFTISFDPNKLALQYSQCNNGVCPGLNALTTTSVSLIDNATVRIKGLGGTTGPGNDLQLLEVHFKSKVTLGTTTVNLTTTALENTSGINIGLGARGASVNVTSGICGDATGDTVVNIIDALAIARKVVGLPPPPTIEPAWADVDRNNAVSIVDAMHIARYSVGLMTPPEVCVIGQPL